MRRGIINVGKPVKTVEQDVKATDSKPKQIIKSLLFISEEEGSALVIVDGESKVDLNELVKILVKISLQHLERLGK
ncbi:MAG: hypothetical protein J7J65_01025 [Candidatus Korarchaeota archaeon]|nr:hypothetical protein [Candidatus Korarchaeota archaeon]